MYKYLKFVEKIQKKAIKVGGKSKNNLRFEKNGEIVQ